MVSNLGIAFHDDSGINILDWIKEFDFLAIIRNEWTNQSLVSIYHRVWFHPKADFSVKTFYFGFELKLVVHRDVSFKLAKLS